MSPKLFDAKPKSRIFKTKTEIPIRNPEFFKLSPKSQSRIFQNQSRSQMSGLELGFGRDRWDLNPECRTLVILYVINIETLKGVYGVIDIFPESIML